MNTARTAPETEKSLNRMITDVRKARPSLQAPLLQRAGEQWPDELMVHMETAQYYLKLGETESAEWSAWKALSVAAGRCRVPVNYRRVSAAQLHSSCSEAPLFDYLHALKTLGLARLRRYKLADARRVFRKLAELDPGNDTEVQTYLNSVEDIISLLQSME